MRDVIRRLMLLLAVLWLPLALLYSKLRGETIWHGLLAALAPFAGIVIFEIQRVRMSPRQTSRLGVDFREGAVRIVRRTAGRSRGSPGMDSNARAPASRRWSRPSGEAGMNELASIIRVSDALRLLA
jgi:hypothetical protein